MDRLPKGKAPLEDAPDDKSQIRVPQKIKPTKPKTKSLLGIGQDNIYSAGYSLRFMGENPHLEGLSQMKPGELGLFCEEDRLYCKIHNKEKISIFRSDNYADGLHSDIFDRVLYTLQDRADPMFLQSALAHEEEGKPGAANIIYNTAIATMTSEDKNVLFQYLLLKKYIHSTFARANDEIYKSYNDAKNPSKGNLKERLLDKQYQEENDDTLTGNLREVNYVFRRLEGHHTDPYILLSTTKASLIDKILDLTQDKNSAEYKKIFLAIKSDFDHNIFPSSLKKKPTYNLYKNLKHDNKDRDELLDDYFHLIFKDLLNAYKIEKYNGRNPSLRSILAPTNSDIGTLAHYLHLDVSFWENSENQTVTYKPGGVSFIPFGKELHLLDNKDMSYSKLQLLYDDKRSHLKEDPEKPFYYILSIDGGGIRGLIPAVFLDYLERTLKEKLKSKGLKSNGTHLSGFFDFFAGTSTGGIIAAGLNVPEEGKPYRSRYEAKEFRRIYEEQGPYIFSKEMKKKGGQGGVVTNEFHAANLEKIFKTYFQKGRTESYLLRESVKPLLVTSYEVGKQHWPWFMASYDNETKNIEMWQAVRATSAAPTSLKPASIEDRSGVDGGVIENNPSMVAYANARSLFPYHHKEDKIKIISIGTGKDSRTTEGKKFAGFLSWKEDIFDVLVNGKGESTHIQAEKLLADPGEKKYFRFQPDLPHEHASTFDVTPENIKGLIRIACQHVENIKIKEDFDKIVKSLIKDSAILEKINLENKKNKELISKKINKSLNSNHLEICNQQIDDEIMRSDIFNFILSEKFNNIKNIDLSDNIISDLGIRKLFQALETKSFPNLKKINLRSNRIGEAGARHAYNFLEKTKKTKVILSENYDISHKMRVALEESFKERIKVD